MRYVLALLILFTASYAYAGLGLGLNLGFSGQSVIASGTTTINTITDDKSSQQVTFTGSQDVHSVIVGGNIFVADAGLNEYRLYSYTEGGGTTLLDTYDATTLPGTLNQSVEISDHVYKISETDQIVGHCWHGADVEHVFDVSGGTITVVAVDVSMVSDTSGTAETEYLSEYNVARYTGSSASPEQLQQHVYDPGTDTFSTSGNAYTTWGSTDSIHLQRLSSTELVVMDKTNATIFNMARTGNDWDISSNVAATGHTLQTDSRFGLYNSNTIVFVANASTTQIWLFDETADKWKTHNIYRNADFTNITATINGPVDIHFINDIMVLTGDTGATASMQFFSVDVGTPTVNPLAEDAYEYWLATDYDAITGGGSPTAVAGQKGVVNLQAVNTPSWAAAAFPAVAGRWPTFASFQANDGFRTATNFTPTATQTIAFVTDLDVFSSSQTIFSMASGTGNGDASASILHSGVGDLTYSDNEAAGDTAIHTSAVDDVKIIILRFNGTGSVDAYVNSTTPTNLDPDDVYSTLNRLRWGSVDGVNGDTGDYYAEMYHILSAPTNARVGEYLSYLGTKYGVTIN